MNNREIKFRLWDKASNRFLPIDMGVGFMPQFGLIHGNIKHDTYNVFYNPDLIFQQYTSLKDKNGKEIYEGDIFKFSKTTVKLSYIGCDYNNPISGEPNIKTWFGEVVFDKVNSEDDFYTPTMLAWGIKNGDRISSLYGELEAHDENHLYRNTYGHVISQSVELVGNIFENSELLEKIEIV